MLSRIVRRRSQVLIRRARVVWDFPFCKVRSWLVAYLSSVEGCEFLQSLKLILLLGSKEARQNFVYPRRVMIEPIYVHFTILQPDLNFPLCAFFSQML